MIVQVTQVAFHFNVADRLAYACRLLRKAVASGTKVLVTGLPETLHQLDSVLWTFSATDFVAHCDVTSDAQMVAASSVVFAPTVGLVPDFPVLLNLGPAVPEGLEQFERVIELVTLDNEDRQLARSRWKGYADRGYAITRHDLALKTAY